MTANARIMRAKYIKKTIKIRETFSFAHPEQVPRVLDISLLIVMDWGSMTWQVCLQNLSLHLGKQLSNCLGMWPEVNIFTYIVENLLAKTFKLWENQIYIRYSRFFQSLLNSSRTEVSFLANTVSSDFQSVADRNIKLVAGQEVGLR